jgi:steroid 5-alpha reductase family enzyme
MIYMNFIDAWLQVGATLLTGMLLLWLLSLQLKDASIIDAFWGLGFIISAWAYIVLLDPQGQNLRAWVLAALVTIWGLRLSFHIGRRNFGKGEDFRYKQWRKQHGRRWWWRSFFQVFALQGALMWVIGLPLLAVHVGVPPLGWLDAVAVVAWVIGFFFEFFGDWQLVRFKANKRNKGKVLDTGLWKYTRHPNYFGDALQWWAFWLFAAAAGGWWSVVSPIVMTWLLRYVSGVDMLDKSLAKNKPGYAAYMRRTSPFIPLPPKES